MDDLAPFGVTPVNDRVLIDGHYVTAAGVSAGIDMALTLTGRIAGDAAAQSRSPSSTRPNRPTTPDRRPPPLRPSCKTWSGVASRASPER